MRKILLTAAAFGLATTMGAAPALADHHEGDKPEVVKQDWYNVNLVRFKPGNRQRVNEIIDMFMDANEKAGTDKPVLVHMNTGPYSLMVFFKMEHGIQQMGWRSTPEGDKWEAAFEELAGGKDEAQAIFTEFDTYIASEENHIGHIHPDDDDEG